MGTIYFHLHNWASGGNFLQHFFTKHKDELSEKGLVYSNTSLELVTEAQNHQAICHTLVNQRGKANGYAPNIQAALKDWQNELSAGKNILISARSSEFAKFFRALYSIFAYTPEFKRFEKKYLVILGRPDFSLEEYGKIFPFYSQGELESTVKSIGPYENLLKKIRRMTREENATFLFPQLAPLADNSLELSRLFSATCDFLKIDCQLAGSDFTAIPGWRSNWLKRILANINNSWEKPSQEILKRELKDFENNVPEKPELFSTPEIIRQLGEDSKEDWLKAAALAGYSGEWQPFVMPDAGTMQQFGHLAEYAPDTGNYIKNNFNILPNFWHEPASRILTEANIAIPLPPDMSVLTMAYNHENMIGECIESVACQKHSFSLEHIIIDDCSKDKTREVISELAKKYPHIKPIFLERKVRGANVRNLFQACKSKYAALCDGDDYFIDENKLQKQYDFLEQNPDCSMCFHPVDVRFENEPERNFVYPPKEILPEGRAGKYTLEDLFSGNFIQTNSAVYRWRFTAGLPKWFRADLCPSDWYWHLLHAEKGLVGFIPFIMSVYRRHPNALYKNSFQSQLDHRKEHGMKELEAFQAINEHFKGKYFNYLCKLSNGVFADLLNISVEEDNNDLLLAATEKYPMLAQQFMADLQVVHELQPARVEKLLE